MRVLVGLAAGARTASAAEHDARAAAGALEAAGLGGLTASWSVTTHVVRVGDAEPDPTAYVAVAASWPRTAVGGTAPVTALLAAALPAATVVAETGPDRLDLGGVGDRAAGARAALEEHRTGHGRVVHFPGSSALVGRWTVGDLVAAGLLDAVEGLAGTAVGDDAVVDLGDFARPTWRAGRRVLLVQPGLRALVPFEVRDQVACCHDH